MKLFCTGCEAEFQDLNDVTVANCGHLYHSACLESYRKEIKEDYNGTGQCLSLFCLKKLTRDIKLQPVILHQNVNNKEPKKCICDICQNVLTNEDIDNIAIAKCGHLFHFNCIDIYQKVKVKNPVREEFNMEVGRCSVRTCKKVIAYIIKIKTVPEWERVLYIILEKYKSDDTISLKEAEHLMEKICESNKLISVKDDKKAVPSCSGNNKSGTSDNKSEKYSSLQLVTKLQAEILSKQDKIDTLQANIEEYQQQLQNTESDLVLARDANIRMEALQNEIEELRAQNRQLSQNNEELNNQVTTSATNLRKFEENLAEMKGKNESLHLEVETLQSQVTTSATNLRKLKENLAEMTEKNEALLLEVEGLQREAITAREANIDSEALQREVDELKTKNEELTQENETMLTALKTLKEQYAEHDTTLTEFMIQESDNSFQYTALVNNLHEQISYLQESNSNMKKFNDHLMKVNNNQCSETACGTFCHIEIKRDAGSMMSQIDLNPVRLLMFSDSPESTPLSDLQETYYQHLGSKWKYGTRTRRNLMPQKIRIK